MISRIELMGKDKLQEIVNSSSTYIEVLEKIGLSPIGNNYETLNKYIKIFEIDLTKININRRKAFSTNKIEDENFLESLENGRFSGHSSRILDRLINVGVKKYECEECGISSYNGKPIRLELHHIDGNNKNNKIENLKVLCPNCHSQTDNFRYKNRK